MSTDSAAPQSEAEVLPLQDAIAALRARGAARWRPVQLRLIESLAQRVAPMRGAARVLAEARLVAQIQACDAALAQAASSEAAVAASADASSPLAALLAHIAQQHPTPIPPAPAPAAPGRTATARNPVSRTTGQAASANARRSAAPASAPAAVAMATTPAELKSVQYFRQTWSRLSADQRVAQSRSSLPENAGPLNSQHLMHRALTLMRELSPDYLTHFITQVDALLWLEQTNAAATSTSSGHTAAAPKAETERKPARSRAS